MFKARLITLLLFFAACGQFLVAQDCAVKLRDAENLFNAGLVEQVPELLAACLESGFTKAEEHSAYQIIIRSYLYEDKINMAEATMLEFLRKNPEYKLSPTDNADFVYLFNKYEVKPVVQLSANIGTNYTFISVIEENSTSGNPLSKDYGNETFSIAAGLEAKISFGEHFEFGAGIDYSQVTFSYKEPFLDFSEAYYPETQIRLEIPLRGYYYPLSFSGFSPYVSLGAAASFNVSTLASVSANNTDANNVIPHTGPDEDRTDSRHFLEPIIIGGIGCKYKLPRSYIFIDISARMGTLNQYKEGLPTNSEWFYYSTDDQFRINNLRFSLGYTYIFYKPSRKEEL